MDPPVRKLGDYAMGLPAALPVNRLLEFYTTAQQWLFSFVCAIYVVKKTTGIAQCPFIFCLVDIFFTSIITFLNISQSVTLQLYLFCIQF